MAVVAVSVDVVAVCRLIGDIIMAAKEKKDAFDAAIAEAAQWERIRLRMLALALL